MISAPMADMGRGRHYAHALLVGVALMALLTACSPRNASREAGRPNIGSQSDVAQSSQYWSERFNASPGDEKAAYAYSRALVAQDQRAQAVAVLQKAVLANAASKFLQGELGKAMAANGQLNEALNVLAQAHTPERPDWRLLSAQGAIHDQLGRPDQAREHYRAALQLAPGETSIMSNLGLSYALSGDLPAAETYLRQAVSGGKSEERARQNLAIVIGLQGRFDEAETVARQDLSPEQATKNIALLRNMLAQTNTWDTIRGKTIASRLPGEPTSEATGSIASTTKPAAPAQAPVSLLQR